MRCGFSSLYFAKMVAMVWCVILLSFTIFHGSVTVAVESGAVEVVTAGPLRSWTHFGTGSLVQHGDVSAVISSSVSSIDLKDIAVKVPGEKKPVPVRSIHESDHMSLLVLTKRVDNRGLSLPTEEISRDIFSHIKDGTDKLYTDGWKWVSNRNYQFFPPQPVSLSDCDPKMVDANQPDPSNNEYVCVVGDFTCRGGCPLYVDNGSEKILLGMYFLQKELPSGHGYVFLNMLHHRKQIEDWIEESEADELQKQNAAKVIQKSWSDHFYGTFKRRNARVLPRASSI